MNRDDIIESLVEILKADQHVHAIWLEGSDANGNLDKYSDIDLCADIDAEAIDGIFTKIHKNFDIDSSHENRHCDAQRQLVFHIKQTERFLMVDFNAYLHGVADMVFIKGDNIDACKVLFDQEGIIRYKEYDPNDDSDARSYWKKESRYRFGQINRVEKYCLRDLYPEAFIYYNKYVIEPLVYLLRSKYTPTKLGYYMVHISNHIPKAEGDKLNRILRISCSEDILANLPFAENWYRELIDDRI